MKSFHTESIIAILLYINAVQNINAKLMRPENFYGSEALLDGYCDNAQYFVDAFTFPNQRRLTVHGSASNITHALRDVSNTG